MRIPELLIGIVDAESVRTDESGHVECVINGDDRRALEGAVGLEWWSHVCCLHIDPRLPDAVGQLVVDVVLGSAMAELRELTGLSWPGFSKLSKATVELPLSDLEFRTGPGEHLVRRLQGTRSLPNVRRVTMLLSALDIRAADLFVMLERAGRPLERMVLKTSVRLAGPHAVAIAVMRKAGELSVSVTGDGTRKDHAQLCDWLGLPTPRAEPR